MKPNRRQLDALNRAGLLTGPRYVQACTELAAGTLTKLPEISLRTAARPVTLAVDGNGKLTVKCDTITRYDELIESHGAIIHAGALVPRTPLSAVKMLRDHDHAQPVGYCIEVDDAVQSASFEIADSEAERVKTEYEQKLRDGVSVGFSIYDYEFDEDWNLHVLRADWYELSLCAVPAVAEAGVSSISATIITDPEKEHHMNPAQLAAALRAGTITKEQHDEQLQAHLAAQRAEVTGNSDPAPVADLAATGTPTQAAAPVVPLNVAAGPEPVAPHRPQLETRDRGFSLQTAAQHIAAAAQTGQPQRVMLAISDVIPADDAGEAFLRTEWLGKLFEAEDARRPWIDAIGTPGPLTSLKGKGWRWTEGEAPEVDEYSGNKTEVPSNDISTVSDTFTAFRIAAGWDVDRAFIDFADPEFTASFLEAVAKSYRQKSNAGIRTRVLAAAQAPGATVGGTETVGTGSVLALLKQLRRDVNSIDGGRANRFFLGTTMWDAFEDLNSDTLPLWLRTANVGMDFSEETGTIGGTVLEHDSTLAANQVVAFDNRALMVKERAPFQVYADNVPKGGVDIGVFSYLRLDDHDPRLIVKRTYDEVLPT